MRLFLASFLAALAACGGSSDGVDPNQCPVAIYTVSCEGGNATGTVMHRGLIPSHHPECASLDEMYAAHCAQGCAIDVSITSMGWIPGVADPQSLCKETPEAKAGDACSDRDPCLPTRARLAADGTVAGQDYLSCSDATQTCVVADAPVIAGYLSACDAAVVSQHGKSGAVGVVPAVGANGDEACLIAWDSAAGAAKSGQTRACVGDWECPAGSLCDDGLTWLDASGAPSLAVCKPGPRATLTPAMLH